jgi:hypothetical protein
MCTFNLMNICHVARKSIDPPVNLLTSAYLCGLSDQTRCHVSGADFNSSRPQPTATAATSSIGFVYIYLKPAVREQTSPMTHT